MRDDDNNDKPTEPVIDEDGFELVQHNTRRNLDRRK